MKNHLKKIAQQLGYVVGRGEYAVEGSVNKLSDAVGRGDVLIVRISDKAAWNKVREEYASDSDAFAALLAAHREPADEEETVIVGWHNVTVSVPQECFFCDATVTGACVKAINADLYAHRACST